MAFGFISTGETRTASRCSQLSRCSSSRRFPNVNRFTCRTPQTRRRFTSASGKRRVMTHRRVACVVLRWRSKRTAACVIEQKRTQSDRHRVTARSLRDRVDEMHSSRGRDVTDARQTKRSRHASRGDDAPLGPIRSGGRAPSSDAMNNARRKHSGAERLAWHVSIAR